MVKLNNDGYCVDCNRGKTCLSCPEMNKLIKKSNKLKNETKKIILETNNSILNIICDSIEKKEKIIYCGSCGSPAVKLGLCDNCYTRNQLNGNL